MTGDGLIAVGRPRPATPTTRLPSPYPLDAELNPQAPVDDVAAIACKQTPPSPPSPPPTPPSLAPEPQPPPPATPHPTLHAHWTAAVCGIGNVALDCARVLLQPPGRLAPTDIAAHALAQLAAGRSAVREVHLVARRGPVQVGAQATGGGPAGPSCAAATGAGLCRGRGWPLHSLHTPHTPLMQAACTPKELKEVCGLPGVRVHAPPDQMAVSEQVGAVCVAGDGGSVGCGGGGACVDGG